MELRAGGGNEPNSRQGHAGDGGSHGKAWSVGRKVKVVLSLDLLLLQGDLLD